MEKHGRLLHCIQELRQMLQTPIKPFTKPEAGEEGEGGGRGKSGRSMRRREGGREEGRLGVKENKAEAAFSGDEDGEYYSKAHLSTLSFGLRLWLQLSCHVWLFYCTLLIGSGRDKTGVT